MDQLELRGTLDGIIGVHRHERRHPQPLDYEVVLDCPLGLVALTGNLDQGIDYDRLDQELRALVEMAEFRLLETAAEALCAWVLTRYQLVTSVQVALAKPRALPGRAEPRIRLQRARKKGAAKSGLLGTVVFQGDGVQVEWMQLDSQATLAGPSPGANVWACPCGPGLQDQQGPWPALQPRALALTAHDAITNSAQNPLSLLLVAR